MRILFSFRSGTLFGYAFKAGKGAHYHETQTIIVHR
jgi:hypothetical protein